MGAPKLLINLLYRASAHPNEMPGWRHCETKKAREGFFCCLLLAGAIRLPQRVAENLARQIRS